MFPASGCGSAQGEKVTAVCDIYRDRLEEGVKFVVDAGQEKPAAYLDYLR